MTYELFERKSVGIIYHFTRPKALHLILEEDRLASGHEYISFTRNPDLKEWVAFGSYCRIAFDGDALSDRWHIEPYLFDPFKDPVYGGGLKPPYHTRKLLYGEEREERIKKNEIQGINKYILQIDVLEGKTTPKEKPHLDKATRLAYELGIPMYQVDRFTPLRPGRMIA